MFAVERVNLPVTEVAGKQYYYYDVQPKETVFSISKRLGLSSAEIIEANPAVADGLQAYMRLYFPVERGEVIITVEPVNGTTHTVKKGETLYGISHQYGVTVDRIIQLNPMARNGVQVGQELIIALDEPVQETTVMPAIASTHEIAPGETLYRIAADNGLTVEQLLRANPGLDAFNYSAGMTINIPALSDVVAVTPHAPSTSSAPVSQTQTQQAAGSTLQAASTPAASVPVARSVQTESAIPAADPSQSKKSESSAKPAPVTEKIIVEESRPEGPGQFDIAVMLPFNLAANPNEGKSRLYTDFYRGLLLAAKSRSQSGKPVNIYAYDTAGSADSLAAILARPEIAQMEMIIAPENESMLNQVIKGVDEDNTYIMNSFVVKNMAHTDHSNVIQANIPQDMMYAKATEAFIERLEGRTPVFIARIKGQAEKDGFTTALKSRLDDRSIAYKQITFRDALTVDDLASLDSLGAYAFIPVSGVRSEFMKFKDGIKQFAAYNPGASRLMGYPDWVTFRGDLVDELCEMNTVIYTRFYNDTTYRGSKDVAAQYRRWYGDDMPDGAPVQTLLGYDTGIFIIDTLRANDGDLHLRPVEYEGIQTDFRLDDSSVDGLVNTSLLLVTFKPDGVIERIRL